jgi:ATP-dependent exoDNAse (exonuclease V) beta subunit
MRCVDGADGAVVTEGVIDAAIELPDEWRVVDWKTDGVDERGWERRRPGYEAQVTAYAEMLAALSGKGASGSLRRLPSAT